MADGGDALPHPAHAPKRAGVENPEVCKKLTHAAAKQNHLPDHRRQTTPQTRGVVETANGSPAKTRTNRLRAPKYTAQT
eukprot:813348-Lingulodinium_polyedra.AAC.1